jgi:hypothetical protein
VAYISLWIPPIGRDSLLYAYASDCLIEANKVLIVGKSIDSWKDDTSVKHPSWFHNQMTIHKFMATIDVSSPLSAKTCILAKVDPRTILPTSIVNMAVRNLAGFMLYFFQNKVKQVIKHPEGEHGNRIRKNPAFYRDWLLPKLEAFCIHRGWEPPSVGYWDSSHTEREDEERI